MSLLTPINLLFLPSPRQFYTLWDNKVNLESSLTYCRSFSPSLLLSPLSPLFSSLVLSAPPVLALLLQHICCLAMAFVQAAGRDSFRQAPDLLPLFARSPPRSVHSLRDPGQKHHIRLCRLALTHHTLLFHKCLDNGGGGGQHVQNVSPGRLEGRPPAVLFLWTCRQGCEIEWKQTSADRN